MNELLEVSPIFIVGVICGISTYFSSSEECKDKKVQCVIKHMINSGVLCTIIYCILTAIELPYLTKIGIAAAITFLGIDKAMSLIREFIYIKK